jgi:hypothetical protein
MSKKNFDPAAAAMLAAQKKEETDQVSDVVIESEPAPEKKKTGRKKAPPSHKMLLRIPLDLKARIDDSRNNFDSLNKWVLTACLEKVKRDAE